MIDIVIKILEFDGLLSSGSSDSFDFILKSQTNIITIIQKIENINKLDIKAKEITFFKNKK